VDNEPLEESATSGGEPDEGGGLRGRGGFVAGAAVVSSAVTGAGAVDAPACPVR
jgi:hypothetical protein